VCGRFVSVSSPALVAEYFGVDEVAVDAHEPDYNVTPRAEVYAVRERDGSRQLRLVRWGLIPSWADDERIGDRLINARAESLVDKPAYRSAFERRRCLIPADGFYEWGPPPGGGRQKQPVFVHRRDGEPLAFAGLWEAWRDPSDVNAPLVRSCAIVTTDANASLAPIHDRMPVVLAHDAWAAWLDPANRDVEGIGRLLVPVPDEVLEIYPVSTLVNTPDANGPALVERVVAQETPTLFDASQQ
jgi:putative SOS response-associated peptidase YedK